jgi:hypothetical protein
MQQQQLLRVVHAADLEAPTFPVPREPPRDPVQLRDELLLIAVRYEESLPALRHAIADAQRDLQIAQDAAATCRAWAHELDR